MNNKYLRCIFFVSLIFQILLPVEAIHELLLQIDTPLKAAIFYFPSPTVMRCLNHSDLPRSKRKAFMYREATFPGGKTVKQTITVGVNGKNKKFIFTGALRENSKLKIMRTDGGPFFKQGKKGPLPFSFFGLEDLIGVQRKVSIKGQIGSERLDYEVFLKTTKGMIGNLNYNLELTGEDRSENGEVKYFLSGKGKLGNDIVTLSGTSFYKDYYVINENFGAIKVYTTLRVYD